MVQRYADCLAWIDGGPVEVDDLSPLTDPYTGEVIARAARCDAEVVSRAVAAARSAQAEVEQMPVHERAAVLRRAADLVEERVHDYALTITHQTGKALKNTLREVARSAWTLRAAATAAEELGGVVHVPSRSPEGAGLLAITVRRPVGVIGAITPFNAPFNLVVHKVAPAFAAGNAIVVKPADNAPISAVDVARLMSDAGAPAGTVNVVPGGTVAGAALVADQRVRMLTFTGGIAAGEAVRRAAGLRPVTLELGGNSPNIVHHDAALDAAAADCLRGGFSNTGQSCNSVQRVIVHEDVASAWVDRLTALLGGLRVGDPTDPDTDVGTLVDEAAAVRVEGWLRDAAARGARVVPGITRAGAQLSPVVVLDAPSDSPVVCQEVFGPVVVVQTYRTLDEAISLANATSYGLQGAVFTGSLDVALRVARDVEVGAVLVNRSSNFRLDHLPYGGVKDSGLGREGPASAVREMTVEKLVVVAPTGMDVS